MNDLSNKDHRTKINPSKPQGASHDGRGSRVAAERPSLITGGAGFIGTNLAHRLLSGGKPVLLFDNLSRPGVERNVAWLRKTHGSRIRIEVADINDRSALRRSIKQASHVFHLAAQVAVTTSLENPIHDFEVNLLGTLYLLEELRRVKNPPPLILSSTNKVYGCLLDIELQRNGTRYEPLDPAIRSNGISEDRHLDFQSPYGCSKGAADQYVLDYARTFGIHAVVFRMSCIYGPHQFGTEDQGWVAHFLIRALKHQPITLYGDGMQVRDILFVDDLVNAFLLALANIEKLSGHAFNVGGGPDNTISLLELLQLIGGLHEKEPHVRFSSWRPGDQRYYVSDFRKFHAKTGWLPRIPVLEGVERLHGWLLESHGIFESKRPKRAAWNTKHKQQSVTV